MKYFSRMFIIFLLSLGLAACAEETASPPAANTTTVQANAPASRTSHITNQVPDYPAEQVAEHTWVIHGPAGLPSKANKGFMNNPIIVITDNSVVIMDPGSSVYAGRMVLRQVNALTDKPVTHVFNSHIHGDHWLGNQAITDVYPQAMIFAHPEMIKEANSGGAQEWLDLMETLSEGETKGTKAVLPTMPLIHGQELKVDNITFRAHLADHAHTHTDLMVEVVNDSLLSMGDNAFNKRMGRMDEGSFRGSLKVCEQVKALDLDVYVPGHGKTGSAEDALRFCDYLATVYAEIEIQTEEGLSDFEMKPLITPKVEAFHDWHGFEDNFGKHISLGVLEYEQASFE